MEKFEEERLLAHLGKTILNTYSMILINRIESVLFGNDLKKISDFKEIAVHTKDADFKMCIGDDVLCEFSADNNQFRFYIDLPKEIVKLSPSVQGECTSFSISVYNRSIEFESNDEGEMDSSEFVEYSSEKYSTYEFWINFKNKLEKMPFHKVEE